MVDYYSDSLYLQPEQPQDQPVFSLPVLENEETVPQTTKLPQKRPKVVNDDRKLEVQNLVNILEDENSSHETIYEIYKMLPFPGVSFLAKDIRQRLFQRLSVVEKRNERTLIRYLSILDDMKAANLAVTKPQWNSAVMFAGRCFAIISAREVEAALHIWKEMEQDASVQGNHVTFNILFDIAAKAGKFVLAEMILKEMKARRLGLNRFAHVGLIYYFGLKGDGDGVRKSYREMVEAGQIIDTVVLNCVIASLIRAGELPAAEQVYQRMLNMHDREIGSSRASTDWKAIRELGRVLDRAARTFKKDSETRNRIQGDQSLTPNVHTYIILVRHHVSETGELHRITTLLNQMQSLGLPIHGRLFLEIFKGFASHGGMRYTSWTGPRLESVWDSFQHVLNQEVEDVYVAKWIAIWTIRAFGKCSGSDRALKVWEELKTRWDPDERESEIMHGILKPIVDQSRANS